MISLGNDCEQRRLIALSRSDQPLQRGSGGYFSHSSQICGASRRGAPDGPPSSWPARGSSAKAWAIAHLGDNREEWDGARTNAVEKSTQTTGICQHRRSPTDQDRQTTGQTKQFIDMPQMLPFYVVNQITFALPAFRARSEVPFRPPALRVQEHQVGSDGGSGPHQPPPAGWSSTPRSLPLAVT